MKCPEKDKGDVAELNAQVQKQQRQGLQLVRVVDAQVWAAPQDHEWGELKQTAESRDRTSDQAEERGE